jgi:hypothetical protein
MELAVWILGEVHGAIFWYDSITGFDGKGNYEIGD